MPFSYRDSGSFTGRSWRVAPDEGTAARGGEKSSSSALRHKQQFRSSVRILDISSSLKNPLQAPSAVGDSGTALKDDHP
ncbi:hypothetical protein, partial [Xanthomonas fragariae]|uniref:hypothetical protein n=1 Tax=Xanthomonas fragariae TaxID=48664 RepID=UPI001F320883